MFQHPVVTDILQKRRAYEQAKDAFLETILSNPQTSMLSARGLETWLMLAVQDDALIAEIRERLAAVRVDVLP